jgi:ribosome recycling factor
MFSFDSLMRDADKTIEVFEADLASVRTGRAKPSLVENINVDAYGSRMKMLEVASITAPEPSQIIIKPWDQSLLATIEKAIQQSDLHISPVNEGGQIRISIPPLTGERRDELAKMVTQKKHVAEEMMRDIRNKYKKQIDAQKGEPGISEDDIKRDLEALQKRNDDYMKKLTDIAATKEKEVREG